MTADKTNTKSRKSFNQANADISALFSRKSQTSRLNLAEVQRMQPGPFQLIYADEETVSTDKAHCPETRYYNCKNYDCCLNIVAALDWEGFTCSGCNGESNQQLLWRAQGECSKDKELQTICCLPDLKQRKIETEEPVECEFTGLRLVVNNKPLPTKTDK